MSMWWHFIVILIYISWWIKVSYMFLPLWNASLCIFLLVCGVGRIVTPLPRCPPRACECYLIGEKGFFFKLRILRQWHCPGLTESVSLITSVLRSERGRQKSQGDMMMHAEVWDVISDFEDDWEPGAEECGQPLEAGKGKEMDVLPRAFRRNMALADTLIWTQWDPVWFSGLEHSERINLCCLKPLSLW